MTRVACFLLGLFLGTFVGVIVMAVQSQEPRQPKQNPPYPGWQKDWVEPYPEYAETGI